MRSTAAVLFAALTMLAPLQAGAAERALVLPAPAYDPPA
ncbi:MAG: peptide-methionine (S)-S-oxide reductase, partial [Methylocystis sp.]